MASQPNQAQREIAVRDWFTSVLGRVNRLVDLPTVLAGALLVGLLATGVVGH